MASLFYKFQEFVKVVAKNPMFARDPRKLQFEADMNRLFLYTSYYRLGMNANEEDAEEIIDIASKAPFQDQEKQVQENIHFQIKSFCTAMDEILVPDLNSMQDPGSLPSQSHDSPRPSGLSFAIGRTRKSANLPSSPVTRPLLQTELSQKFKDSMGYTLDLRPSLIPHKEAGRGLFLSGKASGGAVIAFYPGVLHSPAYYRYIPGYPRVDADNPYLITRYDGIVINALPWGVGSEYREVWNGLLPSEIKPDIFEEPKRSSDRIWKLLSKPLEGGNRECRGEVLERRNPLAFGHFANHPPKGIEPNVMVCPYDFPLTEINMRTYIPNVSFGSDNSVKMKRFGSLWFRSNGTKDNDINIPILKTIVLVATRALCDEEIYLNYRLSNAKRRPSWYTPVDEEEDQRRWS